MAFSDEKTKLKRFSFSENGVISKLSLSPASPIIELC